MIIIVLLLLALFTYQAFAIGVRKNRIARNLDIALRERNRKGN